MGPYICRIGHQCNKSSIQVGDNILIQSHRPGSLKYGRGIEESHRAYSPGHSDRRSVERSHKHMGRSEVVAYQSKPGRYPSLKLAKVCPNNPNKGLARTLYHGQSIRSQIIQYHVHGHLLLIVRKVQNDQSKRGCIGIIWVCTIGKRTISDKKLPSGPFILESDEVSMPLPISLHNII